MWIYEHKQWPCFNWDGLAKKLGDVRQQQGYVLGQMAGLGFEVCQETDLLMQTESVVRSCAIEGEIIEADSVRASLTTHLGLSDMPTSSRSVDGIVSVMVDATRDFTKPLTQKRLCAWHKALFPTGYSGFKSIEVGQWRSSKTGDMRIVSGPIGREKVHFQAPDACYVPKEMTAFLTWFNTDQDMDPLLKSAVAHLWFLTIHPFEDGNGRLARAISDMALARSDGLPERFYSLSRQIERQREAYYTHLERQQRGDLNITLWLDWFLDCLSAAFADSQSLIAQVLYKRRLWSRLADKPVNDRQRCVLNRLMDPGFEGYLNTSKYAKLAKCSSDTALRDIKNLLEWQVLQPNLGGGRSTSYRLCDDCHIANNSFIR
jgi:Fic family protein